MRHRERAGHEHELRKAEMAALVVHDLKNVMMVIGTSLDYATEVADPRAVELLDALSSARAAAGRASRLITNLMDVERFEHQPPPLRMTSFEASALCELAIRPRAAQLSTGGIELAVAVDQLPSLRGDLELLHRVVDNVVDNAMRYTPRGGLIAITGDAGPVGTVRIRVANTGPAVPEPDRERIFAKYERSVGGDTGFNAGLGLYFCRLAVVAHGGRIWCESTPTFPAVFVLELPA